MAVSSIGNNFKTNDSYSPKAAGKSAASVFSKQNQNKNTADIGDRALTAVESKLAAIASKSKNFSVEDLKKFFQNAGIELDKIPGEDVDRFFAYWEKRILECKTAEELNNIAKDFADARKMGLAGILKKYLPKGVTSLSQVSDKELEDAITAFVKENADKLKDTDNTQRLLKVFQKLLDGTKDEDKIRLWNAFKKVAAENKQVAEVLDTIILSIAKSEDVQKFISQIPAEALEALGLSKEELIASLKVLVENSDTENLKKFKQEIEKKLEEFYQKNGEAINNIKTKIQAEEQKIGRKLTDEEVMELLKDSPEEQKLYQAYITIKSVSTGFISGNANNKIISDEEKTDNIQQFYTKLKEYGYHTDVLSDVKEYFNNHKEDFTNSPENFTEILNKATDNNYSTVPTHESTTGDVKTAQADLGFVMPDEQKRPSEDNLKEKQAVVRATEENTGKFSVEKTPKTNNANIVSLISGASKNIQGFSIGTLAKNYREIKDKNIKRKIAEMVAKDNNEVNLVNNSGNQLAIAVNNVEKFTKEQIDKLTAISGIVKKAIGYKEDPQEIHLA